MIHHGDCVEVMATLPENSVDAIVCDPPYGLEFMGKEWDRLGAMTGLVTDTQNRDGNWTSKPFGGGGQRVRYGTNAVTMQEWHQRWATEALRVAKPGAYLLAFGGTRTYHRLAVAIEDAGWIIRDCLVWAYASGFPKGKANLKPAWEPIVMARKPGPLRELAIDLCRIGVADWNPEQHRRGTAPQPMSWGEDGERALSDPSTGRWPANVILTDPIFDGDVDGVVGGGEAGGGYGVCGVGGHFGQYDTATYEQVGYGDTGTYSRFFLIPKADRAEREPIFGADCAFDPSHQWHSHDNDPEDVPPIAFGNRVCRNCGKGQFDGRRDGPCCDAPDYVDGQVGKGGKRRNHHPTVKPLDLMRHLVRLVTPQGGTVLDPFLGSGTTAIAAEMEGFPWIGIEKEAEYVAIAEARLMGVQKGLGLIA